MLPILETTSHSVSRRFPMQRSSIGAKILINTSLRIHRDIPSFFKNRHLYDGIDNFCQGLWTRSICCGTLRKISRERCSGILRDRVVWIKRRSQSPLEINFWRISKDFDQKELEQERHQKERNEPQQHENEPSRQESISVSCPSNHEPGCGKRHVFGPIAACSAQRHS